jgi:hypothetical protein
MFTKSDPIVRKSFHRTTIASRPSTTAGAHVPGACGGAEIVEPG